ncbi:ABC transporter permease [Staphylococcus hominis]|uniref:ABC transporter permease n=1 Tax=Staphylococcus hominis TaxID=1290 RepID=UPI001F55E6A1|nr:ABC transporter permease [Staphylococcus hominis]MCI2928353.1 ABC transporter permease [Staphylococcus hominis]MDS3852884.1 ABC transporter permease [Staphylococcus hominis]
MKKFSLIFKITFLKKVLSKSFILMTLLFILASVAFTNMDRITEFFKKDKKIVLITDNSKLYNVIEEGISKTDDNIKFKKTSESKAKKLLSEDKITYIYTIKNDNTGNIKGNITYNDSLDISDKDNLTEVLSNLEFYNIAKSYKLTNNQIENLKANNEITSENIKQTSDDESNTKESKTIKYITYISIAIMFITILNYSNQAALEIATEKNSKVIEMIITSVSPTIHLWAKILALVSAAITQILIIFTAFLISIQLSNKQKLLEKFDLIITNNVYYIIILSLIFILLGILTFVILSMIIGTLSTNLENINQDVMPLNILLFIPIYIIIFNLDNPESNILTISSYIPFLSPFVIIGKFNSVNFSSGTIIVPLVISIITIIILSIIASRGYKHSLLSFSNNRLNLIKKYIKK